MTKVPQCKDCKRDGITTKRSLVPGAPGPRCFLHHRAERKRVARQAAERRVANGHNMTPETYDELYEYQGRHCAICHSATGKVRRLAVDHDHNVVHIGVPHAAEVSCPECWRGLLCKSCNRLVAWYSPQALMRAIAYLADPPAQRMQR